MKLTGKIKAYSASVRAGVIAGADGKNYIFRAEDWLEQAEPQNQQVNFEDNRGQANRIQIIPAT